MHGDRYARPSGLNPGALALSLGGSLVFLFGLSLTAPNFIRTSDPPIQSYNVPADPPPPQPHDPPKPQPRLKDTPAVDSPRPDPVDVTKPPVETTAGANAAPLVDLPPGPEVLVGSGAGTMPVTPVHVPVVFGPEIDSRYADSFQPAYPAGERTAEREGRVVVRVLIGADGRVKAVEPVSAASAAFFEATRRQALAKWRFKPATRDGVPVEAWRTMAVRFELGNE